MRHHLTALALSLLACLLIGGCGGRADREAEQAFLGGKGLADLTVLPAVLRSGEEIRYDAREAERLAAGLTDQETARAVSGEGQAPLTAGWKASEKAMLRRSAREFRRWVRRHPVGTAYALLPEYLLGTRMVAGVCVYVVDRQGRLAFVHRYDSNDQRYQEMMPIGPADCTNLLLGALHETLRPAPERP